MITAQAHVAAGVSLYGRPYGIGGRRLETYGPYIDCSGLIAVAHRIAGGGEVGAYNSGNLYVLCRDHGRIIPFGEAVNTPGALLFRPENPIDGVGPLGHVVMVRSPGITIESRGSYGVGSWAINRLSWSSKAGLLPSVIYGAAPAAPKPTPEEEEDMGPPGFLAKIAGTKDGTIWWFHNGVRTGVPSEGYAKAVAELESNKQILTPLVGSVSKATAKLFVVGPSSKL